MIRSILLILCDIFMYPIRPSSSLSSSSASSAPSHHSSQGSSHASMPELESITSSSSSSSAHSQHSSQWSVHASMSEPEPVPSSQFLPIWGTFLPIWGTLPSFGRAQSSDEIRFFAVLPGMLRRSSSAPQLWHRQ